LREDVQAIALVDAEVVFGVVEGGSGERVGHLATKQERSLVACDEAATLARDDDASYLVQPRSGRRVVS
jgi:hypothetical protein